MSDDDLKRLITHYELYTLGKGENFDNEDILFALRELLTIREAINEIHDISTVVMESQL